MKVAIVHDWINSFAGAIRVTHAIHEIFPEAPIYTSIYDPEKAPQFKDADVRTTFIQDLPKAQAKHQFYPLLRQRAFQKIDFSEYDLVISSSGSEAKGIITPPKTLHINYCHSPTHYYWRHYKEYLQDPGFGALNPLARIGLRAWVNYARRWDYKAAQRPDYIIANSTFIKSEIKKYYDRESTVIHPPVGVDRFTPSGIARHGFLIVGRQVPFKRFDIAVQACSELGVELRVVGEGSEHERLKRMSGASVTFLTNISDEALNDIFTSAEGFIFPSEDDFGIVAAEALAAGTPVIAYGQGGSRDIVVDGKTGLFFDHANADSLKTAIEKFETLEWDEGAIIESAQQFSYPRFKREMSSFVEQAMQRHQKFTSQKLP